MAVVGNRALPSTESARWSLLGEAERFAVRQALRKAPEFLVQPDVAVQAGDGARARESFAIGAAARLIFQSAGKQVLSDLVEHSPKIVAGVLVAARFKQLLRTERSGDRHNTTEGQPWQTRATQLQSAAVRGMLQRWR